MFCPLRMDFPMYVYKPRRTMKRGDDSKVNENWLVHIWHYFFTRIQQRGIIFCLQETYKLPHRLIEKKRRDRINECIAQLKDLLPEHLKLTVSRSFSTQQPKYETPDGAAGKSFALQVDDKCEHLFLFL